MFFGRKGLTNWQKMRKYLHIWIFFCNFARKIVNDEKKHFSYYGSNDFAGNRLFEETGTAGK